MPKYSKLILSQGIALLLSLTLSVSLLPVTAVASTGADQPDTCSPNTAEMINDTLAFLAGGQAENNLEERNDLAGKTISILGDSISTYTGVSNNPEYNTTLSGGAVYYNAGTLGVYQADTWWQQTADVLDLKLLVNNSWSGSCVLNTRAGTVGAYLDRCVQLHNDTTDEEPDIIAVFLGTNDFSYYQSTLGTADIDYDALITDNGDGTYAYADPATTCQAYAIMLHKMTRRYPNAEVYCMNLLPRRDPVNSGSDVGQPTAFNAELAEVIKRFGCTMVDLENCGITSDPDNFDRFITDKRVHPGPEGMDRISLALIDKIVGSEHAACSVSYNLINVTADASDGIVLKGEPYSSSLTAMAGFDEITVSVNMGGEDITASCWVDGIIHIPSVTADVSITAAATIDDTPNTFRWEVRGNDLICTTGDNALTQKAGAVTNGVINNAYYGLEVPVILRHDQPWAVEWSASGGWSGMIFSANANAGVAGNSFLFKTTTTSGFIGFGERVNNTYENYGVALASLGVDTSAEHIYRVENRIAADGTNMAHLFVDNTAYGTMNNFFIGGNSDQGQVVDWLSGRDFCYSYIGANSHTINNCCLDYIQVWEGGHTHTYESVVTAPTCTKQGYTTYTCDCGDSYRTPWLDENAYEGKTIACIGDSITSAVGVTKDENDYVKLLGKKLGMDYIRLGASGTTLCTDGSRTCNIIRLTEGHLKGADVVTIAMGINDFCAAGAGYYELGDIDSTDSSTIYGAARMWCERIVELRKTDSLSHTQFYFVTPVITSWNNSVTNKRNWDQSKENIHGYTLRGLCNAIIEVAALYDVAVIDLNLLSGMYYVDAKDNNTAVFGGDGVHPGATGHAMMASAMANALLQNNLRDDHAHTFGSWITTTWSSCTAGEQQRVCSICSAVENRTLESNSPHSYTSTITAPTCTQQGYTTYTCACGDSYVGAYTDKIWHQYGDSSCSQCGCDLSRMGAEEMEQRQGGVDAGTGELNTTFTNNWYADILIPDGAEQVIVQTFKTYGNWGCAFLDGSTYVSGYSDKTLGGQWVVLDIPENADVFRYGYLYDSIAQQNGYPIFEYVEFSGDDMTPVTPPQPPQRPATGCHSFSVKVNIAPAQGEPDGYVEGTDYGYIQLPANYSADGEPTRLIIVCHGAGADLSTYRSDAWKNTNYSFWTDLGYAVMDMYACPPELTGNDDCLHYGNPVVLECYRKGYEYVLENFNLKKDGIFLIGSSMGGLSSFQIAQSGLFPVIAQVGYCPVIDLFKQAYVNPWASASYQRSRIAAYFDFEGAAPVFTGSKYPSAVEIEFYRQNLDKTISYSPILRNVRNGDVASIFGVIPNLAIAADTAEAAIYAQLTATHPNPLLIFHNTDDATVSYRYSQYFVDMVNRSGQEAKLYTFHSGGHNAWANGNNVTVEGINGQITIKESQYEAYRFFEKFEKHEEHQIWIDPAVPPTCTEPGLTEGEHCAVCGEVLIAQTSVPMTGHSYTTAVTPPTCTERGYTTYTCACGDSYVDDYVDALGHSFGDWELVASPTYTQTGLEQRVCAYGCGTVETQIVPATGPALVEAVDIVYDDQTNTVHLTDVPEGLTVVLAVCVNDRMVYAELSSNTGENISFALPSEWNGATASVFFLTSEWQPIGQSRTIF